jgi:hypothetical protein
MFKESASRVIAAMAVLIGAGSTAHAQTAPLNSIGVNFVGGGGNADPNGNSITGPAGVVVQDNWNNLTTSDGTFNNLIDRTGGFTTADLIWDGDGTWATGAENDTTGDHQLFNGYVDDFEAANAGGTNVGRYVFSQIPFALYDVYVYADSDATDGRRASYTIGGTTFYLSDTKNFLADPTFDPVTSTTAGTFEAGNYMHFTSLTGASFELVTTAQTFRSFVSGIQVVEVVPEPGALGLFGLGLAALLRRRRGRA